MSKPLFDLEYYQKNITNEAKDWVEEKFPVKYYGDILIFEAWPLRVLFEMTYVAGANEKTKELQAKYEKANQTLDEIDDHIRQMRVDGVINMNQMCIALKVLSDGLKELGEI